MCRAWEKRTSLKNCVETLEGTGPLRRRKCGWAIMVLWNIDCHWIKLAQNRDRDHLPAACKCAVWSGMTSSWLFPPEGAPRALVASAVSCSPRRQRLDVECSE